MCRPGGRCPTAGSAGGCRGAPLPKPARQVGVRIVGNGAVGLEQARLQARARRGSVGRDRLPHLHSEPVQVLRRHARREGPVLVSEAGAAVEHPAHPERELRVRDDMVQEDRSDKLPPARGARYPREGLVRSAHAPYGYRVLGLPRGLGRGRRLAPEGRLAREGESGI